MEEELLMTTGRVEQEFGRINGEEVHGPSRCMGRIAMVQEATRVAEEGALGFGVEA